MARQQLQPSWLGVLRSPCLPRIGVAHSGLRVPHPDARPSDVPVPSLGQVVVCSSSVTKEKPREPKDSPFSRCCRRDPGCGELPAWGWRLSRRGWCSCYPRCHGCLREYEWRSPGCLREHQRWSPHGLRKHERRSLAELVSRCPKAEPHWQAIPIPRHTPNSRSIQ